MEINASEEEESIGRPDASHSQRCKKASSQACFCRTSTNNRNVREYVQQSQENIFSRRYPSGEDLQDRSIHYRKLLQIRKSSTKIPLFSPTSASRQWQGQQEAFRELDSIQDGRVNVSLFHWIFCCRIKLGSWPGEEKWKLMENESVILGQGELKEKTVRKEIGR